MFVLEHKEGEERKNDVAKSLSYDLQESVFISISELLCKSFHQNQLLRAELSDQILVDLQMRSDFQAIN